MDKILEKKICNEIPLIDFGNKIVIRGVLFANDETGDNYLAVLPQKRVDGAKQILYPTLQEWHDIFEQQDYNYVQGELNGEKIILRKSQRNIDGTISWKVFRRDGYKCRYCAIDHVPLTVDHIVLWENNGATHVDNLVSSCKKCNRTRGNMNYRDWLKSDYYVSKMKYLTPEVIQLNQDLADNLDNLPTVKKQRKR